MGGKGGAYKGTIDCFVQTFKNDVPNPLPCDVALLSILQFAFSRFLVLSGIFLFKSLQIEQVSSAVGTSEMHT